MHKFYVGSLEIAELKERGYVKFGRNVRFVLEDVNEYMNKNKR